MIFYLRCRKAYHAVAGSGHSRELAAKRLAAACYRVLSDEVDLVGTWYSDKAIKLYSRFARKGDPKAEDMCLLCQELHAALLRSRETYAERLFEHYRDLSDRAETLEKEMGIRFSESCSNREKLLEDLLDYLKPLVPSDRSDQAALVLGRLLRTDPAPLARSLKDRTRAFPQVMIPDSAAALVQTDQRRRDLEKYRDGELNPARQPLGRLVEKLRREERYFYFVLWEGRTVGALCVTDTGEPGGVKRISPLFILPEYQGLGLAQAAMLAAERLHGEHRWTLETILQEPGNCHLYEKMGYRRTEETTVVNERMTLIGYEKP